MRKIQYILLVTLFMLGCEPKDIKDSELVTETSDEGQVVSFAAHNVLAATMLNETLEVDLSRSMISSDLKESQLLAVINLTGLESCEPKERSLSSFVISPSSYGACDYLYKVGRSPSYVESSSSIDIKQSYGIARVAVSTEVSLKSLDLPPVFYHTEVNRPTGNIDIIEALFNVGVTIDSSYQLSEITTLPFNEGNGNGLVSIDVSSSSIEYTPNSNFSGGVERILYSFKNDKNEVLLGVLDVAVSQNIEPSFFIYDPNNSDSDNYIMEETILDVNEEYEFSINDYVSIPDDMDYQLVHVSTFDAYVIPNTRTSISDVVNTKKFKFSANKLGVYHVSFAVTNYHGTYKMGMIEITVVPLSLQDQIVGWDAINIGATSFFTSPLTRIEATLKNFRYSGFVVDNEYLKPKDVSIYSPILAEEYCSERNGRIPSSKELTDELVNHVNGNPKDFKNWPTKFYYLANDGSQAIPNYYIVNLLDGSLSSNLIDHGYQVTCYVDVL